MSVSAAPNGSGTGRVVNISYQKGSEVEVDMMRVTLKRLTLRIHPITVKGAIARALEEKVWPLLASNQPSVLMDSTYPLRDAAAHRRMEEGAHIGKIVLRS